MTSQPHVYVGETQALGKELELTIMMPEAEAGRDRIKLNPGHSVHINLYLTPEQIRKFSADIEESLDYHLSITKRTTQSGRRKGVGK